MPPILNSAKRNNIVWIGHTWQYKQYRLLEMSNNRCIILNFKIFILINKKLKLNSNDR